MMARIAADLVMLLHLAFILAAAFGGLAVLIHARWMWAHLPMVAWAAWVSLAGWVCPLTPLENRLRRAAGDAGYDGGFVEHYLVPILYPQVLPVRVGLLSAIGVLVLNAAIYALVWRRRQRPAPPHPTAVPPAR